eukprot:1142858-Pelagomonas_calceolata.AAC.2
MCGKEGEMCGKEGEMCGKKEGCVLELQRAGKNHLVGTAGRFPAKEIQCAACAHWHTTAMEGKWPP